MAALTTCESRQVAVDAFGMSFATGVFLSLCVGMGLWSLVRIDLFPYYFMFGLTLCGFGGIWLAIHKPWRDRRRRQRECRDLLQKLSECEALEGPQRKAALTTLNMLALPTSGEPRETRELARRLHRRYQHAQTGNLPIAAEALPPDVSRLPVPFDEV
jgi:hypothetical protein